MQIYLLATNLFALAALLLGLNGFLRETRARGIRLFPLFLLVISRALALLLWLAVPLNFQAVATQGIEVLEVFSTFCLMWALTGPISPLPEPWPKLAWLGAGGALLLSLLVLLPFWPIPFQIHNLIITVFGTWLVLMSLGQVRWSHLAPPLILALANFLSVLDLISVFWLGTLLAYAFFINAIHRQGIQLYHQIYKDRARAVEAEVAQAIHLSHERQRWFEVSEIINNVPDVTQSMEHITQRMAGITHADQAAIVIVDSLLKGQARLVILYSPERPVHIDEPGGIVFDLADCPPLQEAINHQQQILFPQTRPNRQNVNGLNKLYGLWNEERLGPTLIQPLMMQGRPVGALVLGNPVTNRPIPEDDLRLCQALAPQIATLVEYRRRYLELEAQAEVVATSRQSLANRLTTPETTSRGEPFHEVQLEERWKSLGLDTPPPAQKPTPPDKLSERWDTRSFGEEDHWTPWDVEPDLDDSEASFDFGASEAVWDTSTTFPKSEENWEASNRLDASQSWTTSDWDESQGTRKPDRADEINQNWASSAGLDSIEPWSDRVSDHTAQTWEPPNVGEPGDSWQLSEGVEGESPWQRSDAYATPLPWEDVPGYQSEEDWDSFIRGESPEQREALDFDQGAEPWTPPTTGRSEESPPALGITAEEEPWEKLAFGDSMEQEEDLAFDEALPASLLEAQLAIFQAISNGVVVSDRTGRVRLVNQAAERILGKPAKALIGMSIGTIYGEIDAIEPIDDLVIAFSRRDQPLPTFIETEDRAIQGQLIPWRNDRHEWLGIIAVFRDVTREVKADQARSDFISALSRELRAPLTAVKGYSELILRGAMSDYTAEQIHVQQIIYSSAERMAEVLDNAIQITAESRHRILPRFEEIDVARLVNEVLREVVPLAQLRELKLARDIKPDIPRIAADPRHLHKILDNLLSNACRFTPPGGFITVRVWVQSERIGDTTRPYLLIAVADNGVGIRKSELRRIFDPFYQVDNQSLEEVSGMGMGLAVVKDLVELHNGRVWAESTVGEGSVFQVALPLTQEY